MSTDDGQDNHIVSYCRTRAHSPAAQFFAAAKIDRSEQKGYGQPSFLIEIRIAEKSPINFSLSCSLFHFPGLPLLARRASPRYLVVGIEAIRSARSLHRR
jgi:hypothetical protein